MKNFVNDLLVFDWTKSNYKSGVKGTLVLLCFLSVIFIFGVSGLAALFGAFLGLIVVSSSTRNLSWLNIALMTLVVAATFIASSYGENSLVAASILFLAMFGTTILVGGFKYSPFIGLFALVWAIIMLSSAKSIESSLDFSLLFLGGLAVTLIASALLSKSNNYKQVAISKIENSVLLTSAAKALVVAISVVLGYYLFPEHQMWAAITTVVILQADIHTTLLVGTQRAIGTILGALFGVGLTQFELESWMLYVLLVLVLFLMMAYQKVNYILFSFLITVMIVISQFIISSEATASATQRAGATVLGVLIAFLSIYFLIKFRNSTKSS